MSPRNSAGFCGGGQGLSWAVEPGREREREREYNPVIFYSADVCACWACEQEILGLNKDTVVSILYCL
jgi:hypothetical protein